jgi:ATP-binding cassette subfamily B protein
LLASVVFEISAVIVLTLSVAWVGANAYSGEPMPWIIFVMLMAAFVLLRALSSVAAGAFGARIGVLYRRRALVAAISASPDRVREIGPGAAMAKALDVETVGDFLARASVGWILGLVEVGAATVVIVWVGLSSTMIFVLCLAAAALGALAAAMVRARRRWRVSRLGSTTSTMEGLLGLETTQVLEQSYVGEAAIDTGLRAYRRLATQVDVVTSLLALLPSMTLAALVLLLFSNGQTDAVDVAAGIGVALLAVSGFDRLSAVIVDTAATMDAAEGLRELDLFRSRSRSAAPVVARSGDALDQDESGGSMPHDTVLLRASRVEAAFAPGQGLIRPVDLVVREGDRLLISAPSGFGKTTLGEVLAGEREPTAGSVWSRADTVIVRVLQADDDHMFGNSLLFNIAAGVEWPAGEQLQARVRSLLTELELGGLLDTMPAGLAQPVGEGGWRLSSGERTRVSVVAALLREPDVLILDESIATLDGETREKVLDVCVRHSRATVLLAHWD